MGDDRLARIGGVGIIPNCGECLVGVRDLLHATAKFGLNDALTSGDLLEIIDDRAGQRATIITHQLPVEHWHGWIGEATIADAILDRVMQRVHRFELQGESRRTSAARKAPAKAPAAA